MSGKDCFLVKRINKNLSVSCTYNLGKKVKLSNYIVNRPFRRKIRHFENGASRSRRQIIFVKLDI